MLSTSNSIFKTVNTVLTMSLLGLFVTLSSCGDDGGDPPPDPGIDVEARIATVVSDLNDTDDLNLNVTRREKYLKELDKQPIQINEPSLEEEGDQDDEDKTFLLPESEEEKHNRSMNRLSDRYEVNEECDEPTSIGDFEDDILRQADELRTDFYADGGWR